jgi:hypothetical protein
MDNTSSSSISEKQSRRQGLHASVRLIPLANACSLLDQTSVTPHMCKGGFAGLRPFPSSTSNSFGPASSQHPTNDQQEEADASHTAQHDPGLGGATCCCSEEGTSEDPQGISEEEQAKGGVGCIGYARRGKSREQSCRSAKTDAGCECCQQRSQPVPRHEQEDDGQQAQRQDDQEDTVDAKAVGGCASDDTPQGIARGYCDDGSRGDPQG